jgi:hypothetical protein
VGRTLAATIQQQREAGDDYDHRATSGHRIEYLHKNRTPFKLDATNLQNISAVYKERSGEFHISNLRFEICRSDCETIAHPSHQKMYFTAN